ncbi:MAG: TonB-dependent receptor [Rikenellaceae bacterium]
MLGEITEQSNVTFNYSPEVVDVTQKVSIAINAMPLSSALTQIFAGRPIDFVVNGNSVDLFQKVAPAAPASAQQAKKVRIEGVVTTATDGEPCPGATIFLKDTDVAVVSNYDGQYSIEVPATGSTLIFSYIGYAEQEVYVAAGRTSLSVAMSEDITELDDVVVIGYGVTKKKLVTGANINAKGEDLTKLNTTTAMEALQGIAPGLSITRDTGAPGSTTSVTIRGLGTVGYSTPLYIVDGVQMSSIDNINPSFIESIDVLKDAASAAIYGSRAANGVILVTTKKGSQNQKTSVAYNGYFGVQTLANKVDMLDAQEYMYIQDEMRINDGLDAVDWYSVLTNNSWLNSQDPGLGVEYGEAILENLENGWTGTDWLDEITCEARIVSHSATITGGGSASRYSLGLGYLDQEGLVGGDIADAGYQRFNVTYNSDYVLYKKGNRDIITFGENLSFTNSSSKSVATGGIYYNDVYNALRTTPLMPVYWSGSVDESGIAPNLDGLNSAHVNPVAALYYNRGRNTDNNNNSIVGNVYLSIKPIEGLELRSSYGMNATFNNTRSYTELNSGFGEKMTAVVQDEVTQGMTQYTSYTFTNTASYDTQIGKHSLGFLIGNELNETTKNLSLSAWANGSIFDDLDHAYLYNVPSPESISDYGYSGVDWAASGSSVASFMSRVSYSYDDKYMGVVTMRADGSSNFAPGYQWGYFPSVSAGWNFTEESFMDDQDWLTWGKLRFSWGQNGNCVLQDSTGSSVGFVYTSNVTTDSYGYYFGDFKETQTSASYPSNVPNTELTWETSEQLNLGVDLSFFDSRLGATFDWYDKTTKDWLVVAPILGTYGADAPFVNGGSIMNRGVELALRWNDKVGKDFTYGVSVSFSKNKNEVLELNSEAGYISSSTAQVFDTADAVSRVEVGMPIGYFYGYKTDGILQNQAEVDAYVNQYGEAYFDDAQPGDVRFVDYNGDGVIDDNDKTMIGDPNADIQMGFQLNLKYKGAYMNLTATGKFGHQVFNTYFWGDPSSNNQYRNWSTEILSRWTGEGTSDYLPRLTSTSHRNSSYISDLYVYDADFVRISNLTVGYDFSYLVKSGWMKNMSVYLAVNNLYTFTEYAGLDPDVSYGGSDAPWASGVDLGLYATPRTVMVGVNLGF